MNEIICKSITFDIEIPEKPLVDREDGGHLRIASRMKVKDRTELTTLQTIEYALLSEVAGKALEQAMTLRGIEIGNINWQEMGNWSVFKPQGVTLHMHIFGRAKTARVQKYGEAVRLPSPDTGFYDNFQKLDEGDVQAIKERMKELLSLEKYRSLKTVVVRIQ
jgi:diadenosine tetraphosphate (Ap4A) HIT family hydrolase